MVEVKNITKCYGDKKAVDNIIFTVGDGEILGFLGPNGAGKSTTMNIITGYLSSSSGTVTIDGCEILDDPKGAKSKIGYLPEIPPLYMDMTVQKYLEFMFDLKKVKLDKEEHIEEVCRLVKISSVTHRLIKNLSKGYKQRVGFAQALLGDPQVIVLDEPTVGLDPQQIIEIRKLIKSLGKKHTVIFSSHVLSEISETCDRIIIIYGGKIIADAKADSLYEALGSDRRLSLSVEGNAGEISSELNKIPEVLRVKRVESDKKVSRFTLDYKAEADVRRSVFNAMARINCPIIEMRSGDESLEDMYLRLIEKAKGGER